MQPINTSDLTFLNMDRPTNLMVVNGVLWFDEEPDWDAVQDVIRERLIDRFPVLSCRAAQVDGNWVWEEDPDFSLDNHVRHVDLDGDLSEAQEYVSGRLSDPMDRDHALWEVNFLSGLPGKDGQPAAMMMARFHHAVADGIRIVQLLLSMCDMKTDGAPPKVGRGSSRRSPLGKVANVSRRLASDVLDIVSGVGVAAIRLPQQMMSGGVDLTPVKLADAITGTASPDNLLANTMRSVSRLSMAGRRPDLTGDGPLGVEKRVSWVTGLPVSTVKDIGKAHGATVNDVLVSVVSRGLSRFVEEQGRPLADDVSWLIPISLKPIDMNLPAELGNYFAMVVFPMPLGISTTDGLLKEVRNRMDRLKNSTEAMIVFGLQKVVAATPEAVSVGLTEFVANKTLGVLTNVPGPRAPMYLAGTEVTGVLGWVPTAADQPLGICIFSYNGTVSMGIAADAAVVGDPGRLADLIVEEFEAMAG